MRTIIQEGDPVLRGMAKEIPLAEIQSPKIQNLIAEMKQLLSKEKYGVAMAAPQVGEPLKLFIVSGKAYSKREDSNKKRKRKDEPNPDDAQEVPQEDQVYINPTLLKVSR